MCDYECEASNESNVNFRRYWVAISDIEIVFETQGTVLLID